MKLRISPSLACLFLGMFAISCGEPNESTSGLGSDGSTTGVSQQALGRTQVPPGARLVVTASPCQAQFTTAVSGDFEAATLLFSETLLSASRTNFRCSFHLNYTFPAGYRLFRPSTVARGFAHVPKSTDTSVWAVLTRLNGGAWASQPRLISGPFDDDFQFDVPGGEAQGEAPSQCGRTSAQIDVEVIGSIFSGGKTPQDVISTLDSVDTEIDWQRCP